MSDLNSAHNRCVWFDIPVADLGRAQAFYAEVLGIRIQREAYPGGEFCVLDHDQGNGGCLVVEPAAISRDGGILVYLNAAGRLRAAVDACVRLGGEVLEPIHPIGPHGHRAIVRDSEGNRVCLHSPTEG
jgi:uncharacterized protein